MKKKRTRSEGLSLARKYQNSGLPLKEFAKKNGVTKCSVQYWCKQLNKSGIVTSDTQDATFVEVKATDTPNRAQAAKVTVGAAEISFLSLPEASWMSEFVVTVNRYA